MNREQAHTIALGLVDDLMNACQRIQIAGSIRRVKPEVHDIEIVAMPHNGKPVTDLFGEEVPGRFTGGFEDYLTDYLSGNWWEWTMDPDTPRNGQKYKRLKHKPTGICCDLFLVTDPRAWGVILTIRTGPAEFSHGMVTLALRKKMCVTKGLLHNHPKHEDKRPCLRGADCPLIVNCINEEAFFNALDLPWVDPMYRNESWLFANVKKGVFDG